MAQTGDILGPAIQAFLQGQSIRKGRRDRSAAERKEERDIRRLELAEEAQSARLGTAKKKAGQEAEDTTALNQLLQGIFPGLVGGEQPSATQPQAAPLAPTTPPTPQDPFAEFTFTPADEAAATQKGGQEALEVLRDSIEAQRQGGAIEPSLQAQLPEIQQQAAGQPAPVIPPTGPTAVEQERARQLVDLNKLDGSQTITVGGRSATVKFKGTPAQNFSRLRSAFQKDAKAAGIEFDVADFRKLFADQELPANGKAFFKRIFRNETTTEIAQRRKDARATSGKRLTKEEDLQIERAVFDDAIVRFGGLPEGIDAPKGLESLERIAQEAEATAFGTGLGTGAAKAGGPILLTSELAKLEARTNGISQDITKMSPREANLMLDAVKADDRTPVSDKFLFAARAAGLGEDVTKAIIERRFDDISQDDVRALLSELVKTDALTALLGQILDPNRRPGAVATEAGPDPRVLSPEEIQRRDELRRQRDAK